MGGGGATADLAKLAEGWPEHSSMATTNGLILTKKNAAKVSASVRIF